MEGILVIVAFIVIVGAIDLFAVTLGAESREGFVDEAARLGLR